MNKIKIVSVVAYLDEKKYTLTRNSGGWCVIVPPDLKDGQYDTLIVGTNEAGEEGAWSGILYMLTGNACLKIISNQRKLTKQDKEIILKCNDFDRKLKFIRGCCV